MTSKLASALQEKISIVVAVSAGLGSLANGQLASTFAGRSGSSAFLNALFSGALALFIWALCNLPPLWQHLKRHNFSSDVIKGDTSYGAKLKGSVVSAPKSQKRRVAIGLPSTEHFSCEINSHIEQGCSRTALALINLVDFDRLYDFDPNIAKSALTLFANKLRGVFGAKYLLAHIGRGTFSIWFNECDPQLSRQELRTACYVLQGEINTPELSLLPEVTVKVGFYPDDGNDADALLTKISISGGSPDICTTAPQKAQGDTRQRYSLEQGLRHAVERQELELRYQPVIDLARGRLASAEALIRWSHPSLGPVSPATFIPILEEIGLIKEFGLWTLNSACAALRTWHNEGFDELSVAVNLSAKQLHDSALVVAIERTLNKHNLSAKLLTLELTETAAMENADRTLKLFHELRDLGVHLSIDDFGTGYSSLSYLLKLPFDRLKIDREFVSDVHRNGQRRAICRSLVELAAGLEIGLVAEGAEKVDEVEALEKIGCQMVQGFYFSRPVLAQEIPALAEKTFWIERRAAPLPTPRLVDQRV